MAIFERNQKSYDALMKAYNHAVAENQETFTFEGESLVTSYAKYLLEYLKNLL
jgi:hypothetical protein